MKYLRTLSVAVAVSLGLLLSLTAITPAFAEPTDLQCVSEKDGSEPTTDNCDLLVLQKVSVNGDEFVPSDTADTAVNAQIGDTVTWQISVFDVTDDNAPGTHAFGIVTASDVVPSAFTITNFSSTAGGEYNSDTGNWVFTIEDNNPNVLTITTKATTNGQFSNQVNLTDYLPDDCDGPCQDPPYFDTNMHNNTPVAYILVGGRLVAVTSTSSKTTPSAPNTGTGIFHVNIPQELSIYAATGTGLLAAAYRLRRSTPKAN